MALDGKRGLGSLNPADGIKAPKAPKPAQSPRGGSSHGSAGVPPHARSKRDEAEAPGCTPEPGHEIELLYSGGLRSAELLGLDVQASRTGGGLDRLANRRSPCAGQGGKRRIVPVVRPP